MTFNKEKIKTSVWSAIIGAIMVIIIGFGWGGWVLGSTSQRTADTMVEDALVARLSPMCLEQFNKDAQKETKLKELTALNRCADQIVFTGKKAADLAIPSDHCSL